MASNIQLREGRGEDCNRVKIGGKTVLLGDPKTRPEKSHTIVLFPGGSLEIARTEDDEYWVHIATHADGFRDKEGTITRARIDAHDRYCDDANIALQSEIEKGVNHVAFLVTPGKQ